MADQGLDLRGSASMLIDSVDSLLDVTVEDLQGLEPSAQVSWLEYYTAIMSKVLPADQQLGPGALQGKAVACCVRGVASCLRLLDPGKRNVYVNHHVREAALQLLQAALARPKASLPSAAETLTAAEAFQKPTAPDGDLHGLLAKLLQPKPNIASGQIHNSQSSSTPSMQNLSLHQQVLQDAQSQHYALHWLIKICADIALGVSRLLPPSSEEPSLHSNLINEPEGRWVLLGSLLGILDGYVHSLTFTIGDVVPDCGLRRAPKMVKDILLNLTAVADAVGQAQRALLQASHPHARDAAPAQTHRTEQGRTTYHLMNISINLYANQKPAWHEVIQSEIIRSLLLAGSPAHMPRLSPTPKSSETPFQQSTALQGSHQVDSSVREPVAFLLTQDGVVDKQATESASVQFEPYLLHQALLLATDAQWVPQDFGACASDSSESDSAASEPSQAESAEDEDTQAELTTTGFDRVLAVAIIAAYHCCPQPAHTDAISEDTKLDGCTHNASMNSGLDSNFSMSSEIDDPLGMQHLFEEQPSDDNSNALAACAPARPANPWASVLQLSLQCLIRWLHSRKESLARQHMDAIMCLLSQQVTSNIKASSDAPIDSNDSQQHAVISAVPGNSFKELHQALLEEAMRDEAVCAYIVGHVLTSPARPHGRHNRQQSSKANGLWQLAAISLMHNVQECVAMNQECKLAMDLWLDLIVGVSCVGSNLTTDALLWQLAQPKLDLIMLTSHTFDATQRTRVVSMILQGLLSHSDPKAEAGMLDCASIAFLLHILQYVLVQVSNPPAAWLINSVDVLLKGGDEVSGGTSREPLYVAWLKTMASVSDTSQARARDSKETQLAERLASLFPCGCNTDPVIGGSEAAHQLQASLEQEEWQAAHHQMTDRLASKPSLIQLPSRPKSCAEALDRIHAMTVTCLDAFQSTSTSQSHTMEVLFAEHACCGALMQLFLSVSLPPADTEMSRAGQTASISQMFALVQPTAVCNNLLACWPHVSGEPASVGTTSSFLTDCTQIHDMLQQACTSMVSLTTDGNKTDQMLSCGILDLALLQAWNSQCLSAAVGQDPESDMPVASNQAAGLLLPLEVVLGHLVSMTERQTIKVLSQQLSDAAQQDKIQDMKAVLQMGLPTKEATDALEAIHSQLGSYLASLTWQHGPAPWQTFQITSHFPAAKSSEPGLSAMSGIQESMGPVMYAAVAMHGLPVTAQPDSSQMLSCIRGLASVVGLVLHIVATPGLLEHAAGEECLEGIVAALTRLTPAIHGYVIRDAEMLSGLIRSSKPDVVQKAEEEQQLRQRAVLLSLLNAWKADCAPSQHVLATWLLAFKGHFCLAPLTCSQLVQGMLSVSLELPSDRATVLLDGLADVASQPSAGGVNIIFAGLVASGFPMDKFLSLHLLKSGVATQQRAASLRLLQAVLVPQLSPIESSSTAATPTAFTPNAEASASTPIQLTSDDQQSQFPTQRPGAHEAESTTPAAAPDQQIVSTEALQQCQQKLLAKLLRAIPNVLTLAVSGDELLAECGQQLVSQANAPQPASQGSAQSISDADLQNDVEAPREAAQQDSEAVVIDGDAMHALLGLMLHAAADPAVKGMDALLEFPEALADAMSDLLASPQGTKVVAQLLPLFRFLQAAVHHASRPPLPEAPPTPPPPTAQPAHQADPLAVILAGCLVPAAEASSQAGANGATAAPAAAGTGPQAAPAAPELPPTTASSDGSGLEDMDEDEDVEEEVEIEDDADEEVAANPRDPQTVLLVPTDNDGVTEVLQMLEQELAAYEEQELAAIGTGRGGRGGSGRGRGRATRSTRLEMEDLVDLAHETALVRSAGGRGRRGRGQGRDAGRGRGSSAARAASNARGAADVMREDGTVQCTFSGNGDDFIDQHWYFCYTCGLVDSKGCCSACAQVCHAGHDLVYSTHSRFFCDCGAGVPRCPTCKCLTPVHPPEVAPPTPAQASSPAEDFPVLGHPFNSLQEWDPAHETSLELEHLWQIPPADDGEEVFTAGLVTSAAQAVRQLCADNPDNGRAVLERCASGISRICKELLDQLKADARMAAKQALSADGPTELTPQVEAMVVDEPQILVFKGSFKLAAEPRGVARSAALAAAEMVLGRDSHDALEAQVVSRCTAAASPASGLLAVARARQLAFIDLAAAATAALAQSSQSSAVDSMAVMARHSARFDVLQIQFDAVKGMHLAVAGLRIVQVWSVSPAAKTQDRLPVQLPTPQAIVAAANGAGTHQLSAPAGGNYMDLVLDIAWLPGSDTCLAVTMPLAVLVFDLAVSARQPSVAVVVPSSDLIASSAVGAHMVAGQGPSPELQTCLVILTREATVWSAPLLTSTKSVLSPDTTALHTQAAQKVDLARLLSTDSGADSESAAAAEAASAQSTQQLYGKSLCFCPATAMYVASLGNAQDEDQNVTWLMTVTADGTSIAQVASMDVALQPASESAAGDSTSASAQAALQHPDPESDAEHVVTEDEDDGNVDEQGADNNGEESEAGSNSSVTLPSVERSYAVPLLPASRHEMQSPGLVVGVPSHGLPGLVATLFESAHSDGTGCAIVTQIQDMQSADAPVVGIASLPLPHAQQVAIVALDSQGYLHLYTTPLAGSVVVWDPFTEAVAEGHPSTAPEEPLGTGSVGSRGVVGEGEQAATQPAAESGGNWTRFLNLARSRSVSFQEQLEQSGSPMHQNPDALRSRAFERLLAASCSTLASSSQPSLAAVGRTITTGAEAPSASTPAADAAAPPAAAAAGPFIFDFFEKTRCINGEVKLSGDLTQTGGSERAWRVLVASGTYLEAPSASGMRINMRPDDASLVVVGARVMVGGSGGRYSPSEVKLGGRSQPLPSPSAKRWHVLRMTPAEALAAAPDTAMQVGPAQNPASLARLDGLEVYARPKTDLVKEAAAAAEAEAAEAPSGNLSSNLNLAAISLPGHLIAQKAAQTCSNFVLSEGLLTLTSLHQLLAGISDAEEPVPGMMATANNAGHEVARDLLLLGCRLSSTQWQPGNVLMCAAWTLLAACLPNQSHALQHALQQIDEENLKLALHGLQRCVSRAPPAPALWPDTFLWWYLLIAAKVLTIAMHRPASLTAFFRQQHSKTESEADASPPMHEVAGLLVQALPWVLHSLRAHTSNPHFPPSFLRWLVQAAIAAVISCAEAAVGTLEDSAGAASPEGVAAVSAMAADLLRCPITEVSEAAAAELTQALLTSKKAPEEPSGSVQPASAQPSIQLHAGPAAAAALATSLAGLVKGHSWPGYQLLSHLALADIQDGNERVTGIAQHVMSCTLKALLDATAGDSSAASDPAQIMQLLLLAQICSACEDSGESSPTAGDSAAPKVDSENVEVLMTILRSADQLPELLLGLVKSCIQQLQEEGSREETGQLAEALPGEAPGCGELLKSKTSSYKVSWDAYQKKQASFLGTGNALVESEACVVMAEACLCLAAAAGPQTAEQTDMAVWKELLGKAQQCEQLSKGRKSMRKLMLQLYGGHSAYHDAKAYTRLTQAHKALQAAAVSHSADPTDHSAAQHLVGCLGKAKDAAETRPKVWLSLVESEEGALQALVAGLLSWQMPSALERALQLVMLLLPAPEIPKDGLKVEKATRDLDLKWLFVSQSTSTGPPHSSSTLSSQQLTATPYAHLVATLLLAGPSKAVRNLACSLLKSLWLLESVKALNPKPATSAPAQHAQHAMLTLLLCWIPILSAYPVSVTLYFQLLTWMLTTTPTLSEQLKNEPGSSKKKGGGSASKALPKGGTPQGDKPKSSSSSSSSAFTTWDKAEALIQDVVTATLVEEMFSAVKLHNAVLADHLQGGIYQQLQRVVNFEGCYLDGEEASSVPREAVYQSHKLDSLEAEAKYTDNRTMVRLTGRYQIKSFTLQVHSLRKPRTVRQVHVHHCAHPLAELSELKTRPDLWRKCATLSLAPYQTQAKHSLTVPVAAGCIMMEFADFWENLSASSAEVLQCPRCSQVVAHPQGYCRYCKENAYQCRHCRNINHEKLDAFMCNECGHSRFGKFELSMSCSPCVSYPPLQTQDDMLRALACLEHNVGTAHTRHTSLATCVKNLTAAMSSWGSQVQGIQQQPSSAAAAPATIAANAKGVNPAVASVATMYNDKCKPAHEAAVEASQAVDGVRSALTAYLRQGRKPQDIMLDLGALGPAELKSPGGSYRCADIFLGQCLPFMLALAKSSPRTVCPALEQSQALQELFTSNLKLGLPSACQAAKQLLVLLYQQGSSRAKQGLVALIKERVLYCIHHHRSLDVAGSMQQELGLLTELVTGASNADAQAWQSQMLLLFQLLLPATGVAGHNPAISEHVIMPCLTMLLHTIGITPPAAAGAVAVSHTGSASDARTPVQGLRPLQPEATPATAGSSGGAHGEGQKLLEEVGPGVSLEGLAVGRASFQGYLERCNTQAGMLAAGALDKQARRALRCGRLWRHQAHRAAMQRSTGTASATDLPSPVSTTAPLTHPQSALSVGSLPLLESGALFSALLLNPTHDSVRSLAVSLLKQLCLGTPHMTIRLVSRLAALLPQASAAGPAAAQYFNLLQEQMTDTAVTMHLVSHDMLASIMQQIKLHTNVLIRAEYGCSLALLDATNPGSATSALNLRGAKEVTGGYSLTRLTSILAALTASPGAPAKFAKEGLLEEALLALAGMSAVEVGRTHLTDDAEGSLLQLLHELWVTGTLAARSEFARAGMSMLTQLWDSQGPSTNMPRLYAHLDATILEEVCIAIKPESNEAVYLMLLDKSPTQEEFIRGQLTNNPYNSAEVGPLMRDVKNFICRELDMEGLVDDDFGMELLVGGAIISLSLPVRLVWECVWRPTLPSAGSETSGEGSAQGLPGRGEVDVMGPPMLVTYRLQGLDGEATERMIEHLAEPASEQQEAEQEYAVARALAYQGASGSLPRLLQRLVSAKEQHGEEYRLLLKLLLHASHLKVCKQTMLSVGGLQSLLRHLHQLLQPITNPAMLLPSTSVSSAADSVGSTVPSGGSADSKGKLAVAPEDLDILLTILEALAASGAAANSQVSAKGLGVDVHGLADGLKALVEAGLTKAAGGLARVLPYLAHGNAAAQAALLDHYAGCLDLTALDAAGPDTPPHQAQQSELQSLLRLTESTEEGQAQAVPSTSFRALVLDRAIPQALAGYALALFTIEPKAQANAPTQFQQQPAIDDQSEAQSGAQAGVSVTASAERREEDPLDGQAGQGQKAEGELGRQQSVLCKKGGEQSGRAISMPGLPWALQLLAAFARGHPATCDMLAEKVHLLSLLHQLEAVSSGSTIGPLAESLLEELQEAGASPVGEAIKKLRAATKAAMKQKAMARRKAMLASLNMPSTAAQGSAGSGASSSAAAAPTASSQAQHAQQAPSKEEEEERRGLVCMVCKEGYASRPKELLAAYCYCMKLRNGEGFGAVPEVWQGSSSTKSDALQAWMCVSHFNLIHNSCHQAAKQADAGLRAPKREWEGATLRNGETLCNNLLPLKTAGVSDTLHAAAVATFMEALGHAPHKDSRGGATTSSSGSRRGHSSSSASGDASLQVGALAGSMACLLQRLAYGESLSVESRGGGQQSNARLLPYLFQLGLYFAGFCSDSDLQTHKARLDKLREWPSSSDTASSSTPDKATAYLLVLSLFVWSPTQWTVSRQSLLLYLLRFAFDQQQPSSASSSSSTGGSFVTRWSEQSDEEVWRCAFPVIRYFGLVQCMYQQLKDDRDADWHAHVKSRVEDLPATVEAADNMLEHLVQLETATSYVGCFQILAMKEGILQHLQQPVDAPFSDEQCMQYIRKALS